MGVGMSVVREIAAHIAPLIALGLVFFFWCLCKSAAMDSRAEERGDR